MILKSELKRTYLSQQEVIQNTLSLTNRDYYQHITTKTNYIEVVCGIRRCGKSTLMRIIMLAYGANIAYFNFEDSRIFNFEVSDFEKLDEIIGKGKKAYFFDEIQNIDKWELFIRQLHDRGEKIFITGSNASLLSKELGTRLTGRHLRHELFPFSYSEFLDFKGLKDSNTAFNSYLFLGGFPEFLRTENYEILQTLLKDIVMRDIAIRHGIKNTKSLMDITLFLISNIGKPCSFNNIKKTFEIGSANTVSDYLAWLEDAYIFFFLQKFSWSAKSMAVNPKKVYTVDTGLAHCNSSSFSKDSGRLLENCVYIHLRKQYTSIYYFKEKKECDFVVFEKEECKLVIQVCEELNSDNKDREINGLIEAMAFFKLTKGLIITKNQNDVLKYDTFTIHVVSASDFLLNHDINIELKV